MWGMDKKGGSLMTRLSIWFKILLTLVTAPPGVRNAITLVSFYPQMTHQLSCH